MALKIYMMGGGAKQHLARLAKKKSLRMGHVSTPHPRCEDNLIRFELMMIRQKQPLGERRTRQHGRVVSCGG